LDKFHARASSWVLALGKIPEDRGEVDVDVAPSGPILQGGGEEN